MRKMFPFQNILASPYRMPLFTVAAVVLLLAVSNVIGRIEAARKLADINFSGGRHPSVKIGLNFTPERFQFQKFQDIGRYEGWHHGYAVVLDANPAALRRFARNYWVSYIKPYRGKP